MTVTVDLQNVDEDTGSSSEDSDSDNEVTSEDDCEKCHALTAIFDQHPWLWDPAIYVISGPKKHSTWCRRRTQYEMYKSECTMPVDKKFVDEVVKAHNEYRSRHQASSIKHAKDLSEYAQKWADHLVATGSFQHSSCDHKGDRLGENIAMKWSSRPDEYSGQEVTDQWYSEVKVHTFGSEPRSLSSGHFTQVVWKDSREMGVGKATGKDGKTIVVASYRPAGNMVGTFSQNVLPPKDGKIVLPVKKDEGGSGKFASRFDDARRGFGSDMGGASGGGTETKTTRTYTVTEGSGANAVTKTVVEETIIKPDGSKVTRTKETVTSGGSSGGGSRDMDNFGKLSIGDDRQSRGDKKDKKKSKHRSSSSSSSSSDSSPESSKRKAKGDKNKPQKIKDFIDDAVKVHNEYRSKHSASKLKHTKEFSEYAQKWAEHLAAMSKHGASKLKHAKDLSDYAQKWAEHLAATNSFQHSDCMHKGEKIGENICCKWSSSGADYTGREACEQWYSEISKHDFNNEPRSLGSGHFTQMVWKASKEMGIGKAKTSGGKVIVVANYRPAGNFVGRFVENVGPLKK